MVFCDNPDNEYGSENSSGSGSAAATGAGSSVGVGGAGGTGSSGGAGGAGGAGGSGGVEAKKIAPMPEGWFFPFIIMAAAWSPWSGNCPQQWNNLQASNGKSPKNKKGDQLGPGPLSSPEVMAETTAAARTMDNDNGVPSSRRANDAAIKREADRVRKEKKDKENMVRDEKQAVLRAEGVEQMKEANANSKKLTEVVGRLAVCREQETSFKRAAEEREKAKADSDKRARKIGAVERLLMRPLLSAEERAKLDQRRTQLLLEQMDE